MDPRAAGAQHRHVPVGDKAQAVGGDAASKGGFDHRLGVARHQIRHALGASYRPGGRAQMFDPGAGHVPAGDDQRDPLHAGGRAEEQRGLLQPALDDVGRQGPHEMVGAQRGQGDADGAWQLGKSDRLPMHPGARRPLLVGRLGTRWEPGDDGGVKLSGWVRVTNSMSGSRCLQFEARRSPAAREGAPRCRSPAAQP